jgi:hypothetical protein
VLLEILAELVRVVFVLQAQLNGRCLRFSNLGLLVLLQNQQGVLLRELYVFGAVQPPAPDALVPI